MTIQFPFGINTDGKITKVILDGNEALISIIRVQRNGILTLRYLVGKNGKEPKLGDNIYYSEFGLLGPHPEQTYEAMQIFKQGGSIE
jgi:hypothetical protein